MLTSGELLLQESDSLSPMASRRPSLMPHRATTQVETGPDDHSSPENSSRAFRRSPLT